MFVENRRLIFFSIISILIAIGIYPVSFDGRQVISLDAPLISTFDVLVNYLWKFHPFIVNVEQLEKINSTCTYYKITDRIPLLPLMNINLSTIYYVQLNIDKENSCITSFVQTQFNIMNAHHQYCMYENTLQSTITIITDQFYGKSWMIFKYYIRKKMLLSHKYTLEKLRKEMMIYSTE